MNRQASNRLELTCPSCGVVVLIAQKQQVEGEPVGCPSCAADLVLARETETEGESWHWLLVNLEEEAGNEK